MPVLESAAAARIANSVSEIFNEQNKLDRNQSLNAATIISHDPNYNRPPDYYLYIFNISDRCFVRYRPPDFPRIEIAACPKGEPYVLAVRVPNIINYKFIQAETGAPAFSSIKGERWATDLINPANLGEQMWVEVTSPDMDQFHGGGDDLSRRGVFWSHNTTPTAEELSRARTRMERHYREVVQQAERLARDPKTIIEIGEEHHIAADYLNVNATWHIHTAVQNPCPNCGEPINPNIAYHASSTGGVCVIDWQRTVEAGIKSKADVPESKRWWKDEPTAAPATGGAGKKA